ncbi:MAG: hypothetical protein ACSHWU_01805 [Marinicella sp.]
MNIGLEARGFFQDPLFSNQDNDLQPSVFIEPEWKWRSDNRNHRFSAIAFMRWDEQDSKRTHGDLRELYWSYSNKAWTTTFGLNKVFWGVTESAHLVDVINQTDWVEDLDQEDKLGQPMLHFSRQQNWGRLQLFVLPYFRERTFPGADGRFGFGQAINDDATYESRSEQNHIDLALRYSHYFGDLDLGIHLFKGTDREPLLIPSTDANSLTPYYQQMNQFGVDLQYTIDAWLWKFESIYKNTQIDSFWAAVGGLEYTLYQINDSSADLGLLVEYQYDGRQPISAPSAADNDLFLAARWALNDSKDTAVLGGISYDIERDSVFLNVEAETRLNNHLTAELRIRAFSQVDPSDSVYIFNQNDYVQLNLNWFF